MTNDDETKMKDEVHATFATRHSSLVVGLGNPILGDDGVGWRVAEQVQRQLEISGPPYPVAEEGSGMGDRPVDVDCVSLGGIGLMEQLIGYDRAILIDALVTGKAPVGTVTCFALEELTDLSAGHTSSAHDTSLQTALKLGRAMGAHVPDQVTVIAVEARNVSDFSEELSPPVAAAVPLAVEAVMNLLHASD